MAVVKITLNGKPFEAEAPYAMRLLDFLREKAGLKGTKEGCGEGECGACTVLLDGKPVDSCLVLTGQVLGRSITTVEGLGDAAVPHPIQRAFAETGAVQCGFCTPGMELSAYALLERDPDPGEEEIRDAISGNLCRCTGYTKIVDAIRQAAGEVKK